LHRQAVSSRAYDERSSFSASSPNLNVAKGNGAKATPINPAEKIKVENSKAKIET